MSSQEHKKAKKSGAASRDWRVCSNPQSPRAGLLTFEHQTESYFGHIAPCRILFFLNRFDYIAGYVRMPRCGRE